MNKDTHLIFEAYRSKQLLKEAHDQNYIPSLEEIKEYLTKEYKSRELQYSNKELFDSRMADLDRRASTIEKMIKAHKDWVEKWNSNPENSDRTPYTVWSSIYSELSDDYKDLNGFRYRTTFEQTPIIVLANALLDTREELKKEFERQDKEAARVKSHAEVLYSNPQKLEADVIKLVNAHAEEAIQNIATIIDRELIKSIENPGDAFTSQVAHMIMNTIHNNKEINLNRQERAALIEELRDMYTRKSEANEVPDGADDGEDEIDINGDEDATPGFL